MWDLFGYRSLLNNLGPLFCGRLAVSSNRLQICLCWCLFAFYFMNVSQFEFLIA